MNKTAEAGFIVICKSTQGLKAHTDFNAIKFLSQMKKV